MTAALTILALTFGAVAMLLAILAHFAGDTARGAFAEAAWRTASVLAGLAAAGLWALAIILAVAAIAALAWWETLAFAIGLTALLAGLAVLAIITPERAPLRNAATGLAASLVAGLLVMGVVR